MAVVDADSGKVLASLAIGAGCDTTGFDADRGLAFASAGDCTITVTREESKDKFKVAQTVTTEKSSRAMALDPETNKLFTVARTGFRLISSSPFRFSALGPVALLRGLMFFFFLASAFAQGGPPYYSNDPGTPGHLNWEINLGYMPFLYSNQSVSHTPDLDINFGVGDRIQLTYENAWLRVQNPSSETKFGLGQSNLGLKWRFYDAGESGLNISVFPQAFLNNPNHAVRRGITPASQSFLLPFEFSKKFGPIGVDYEIGYQFTHKGPDGWLTGLVLGHDFTSKFEMDMEFYAQGTFHPSENQPTIGVGARYKIHKPVILLLMTGRSLEPTRPNQSYFVGYFGLQFLLPPKSYK